jgi:hypothetical protein
MPKFRFTTQDGDKIDRDDEPLEFPSERAATDDAQRALVDMASDKLPNGERADLSASVENEAGAEIYRASLKFRREDSQPSRSRSEDEGRSG